VHLCDWPSLASTAGRRDEGLEERMRLTRELASLGRAARADAGVKVRQPLARALVFLHPGSAEPLLGVVADELNVDHVELAHDLGEVLSYELVANYRVLGPRLGERVKLLRDALAGIDAAAAAADLEAGRGVVVTLDGEAVELGTNDVELRVRGEGQFAVTRDSSVVVALDLTLNDELVDRGLCRDLIRQVQDLRRSSGFSVSDRIDLWLTGAARLAPYEALITAEVLAERVLDGPGQGPGTTIDLGGALPGVEVWIERR
jgi:isoleucyl-tRNA synthetase